MPEVSFLRHAGWFGPEDAGLPLNIIGVGATGSHIGLIAARMGFHKFRVWDPDIVEDHNLPNQIYDVEHINKQKVDAFEDVLTRFNPRIRVEKHNYYFNKEHKEELSGPLVLTVDTMKARKEIYHAFRINWKVKSVFETRVGFDYAELNVIDNMNTKETDLWFNCLKNDDEIPEGPCNLRICTTLVAMVAAHTVHTICNMLSSNRREESWDYSSKTIFNLSPRLETHNL
jgi:hypothetical protein